MKKTLILWIDAINKSFITKQDMPFLHSLANKYGVGELKQCFGYSSIAASFFTGLYPNKHGQFVLYKKGDNKNNVLLKLLPRGIASYYFNLKKYISHDDFTAPLINKKGFVLAQNKQYYHKDALNAKTLFDFLKENDIKYLYYQWPIVADSNKTQLSFCRNSDKSRVNKFLKLCNKDYDIFFLHLWNMDKCGHKYGPEDSNYKLKLREQDDLIRKVIDKFDLNKDNVVIWSDHGMIEVNKSINIESRLPKKEGYSYFLDSTMARFWFDNDEIKKEITNILKNIKEGHLLSKEKKEEYKINFLHNEYGDEVFLLKPGMIILPNFFQDSLIKGMHGYDLTNKKEYGITIINKKFKKNINIVDLLPTILNILEIKTEDKFDGKSILY